MWTYLGAGVMPEVPGVPARDLTDAEYKAAAERLGESALRGVYAHEAPAAREDTDDAE